MKFEKTRDLLEKKLKILIKKEASEIDQIIRKAMRLKLVRE